jgi:hypothetical protein
MLCPLHQGDVIEVALCDGRVPREAQGGGNIMSRPGGVLGQGMSKRGIGVDALTSFTLCPLTTLRAVAYNSVAGSG